MTTACYTIRPPLPRLAVVLPLLRNLSRNTRFRGSVVRFATKLEGGTMWSPTLRWALASYYQIKVGRLSYGPCLLPGGLPRGTEIGSFCSIAAALNVFRRNHPIDRVSQHPIFFNSKTGAIREDNVVAVEQNPLHVDHDVWIGHGVIVTPACRKIGMSSIVASGAVVTKDVEPFTIVGGNPARHLRTRFDQRIQDLLIESQWWNQSLEALGDLLPLFARSLTFDDAVELAQLRKRHANQQTGPDSI